MCVVNFEGSSPSNNAKKFGDALAVRGSSFPLHVLDCALEQQLRHAGDGPALDLRHSNQCLVQALGDPDARRDRARLFAAFCGSGGSSSDDGMWSHGRTLARLHGRHRTIRGRSR